MRNVIVLASLSTVMAVAPTHAEVRGVVRFGVLPLDLESSRDTPLFGDYVDDAVTAYNAAASAYDARNGTSTERIDQRDVGVHGTLVMFRPGVEIDFGHYFFRTEAVLGTGDGLRTAGIGIYPLNFDLQLARDWTGYVSGGGSAGLLDRSGSAGTGALVTLRAAMGVRYSERVTVEVGYGAFTLGGIVDQHALSTFEPSRTMAPPAPSSFVAAGEASDLVDVSAGIVF